jgi:hypothetical protein
MGRTRQTDGRTATVIYRGPANTYIDFPGWGPTHGGIAFTRGVETVVPAALLGAIEATGLFEIVSAPEPAPLTDISEAEAPSMTEPEPLTEASIGVDKEN